MSLSPDEEKLYSFLVEKGSAATQAQIQEHCKFEGDKLATALNGLLGKSRVQLFMKGLDTCFSAVLEGDLASHAKLAGLSHDEGLVYQSIDKAKDNGIAKKFIGRETGITPTVVTKVLKSLEAKRLIKQFRSFGNQSKIMYINFELQPNKRLCGGVFWDTSNNSYDIGFVEALKKIFYVKIQKDIHTTVDKLLQHYVELRHSGLLESSVDLEKEEIQQIVNIMIHDGDVDVVRTTGDSASEMHYRLSYIKPPELKITEIPCTACPVAKHCSDTGEITPEKCVYLQQWLDF